MKKVLFMSLAMAVAMTGFAQKVIVNKSEIANQPVKMSARVLKGNEASSMSFNQQEIMTKASSHNSLRGYEENQIMTTYYDLQSNSALGNRIATWDDGTAAFVATWDNSGSTSFGNRGTGYNYFDGESFGEEPYNRVESVFSGWPSIAAAGEGEILASHANSKIHLYKREMKGQGDWISIYDTPINTTWPRVGTTHNGQYVHVVSCEQNSSNNLQNFVYYYRSTDGGQTFTDPAYPPMVDVEGDYNYAISADDYIMATNGDNIAILFAANTYDLFYIISHDNGETWEKQTVWNFPYGHAVDWENGTYTVATDSIWAPDGSSSMVIDDNGTVHVAFGLTRWVPSEDHDGSYTYFPYTDGLVYWNSNYTNEQGTHEILNYGEWSGDVDFPEMAFNGTNGISSTLNAERIWAMAGADGYANLYVISAPDENGDGEVNFSDFWNNTNYHYRTHCQTTMPGISIDEMGNMIIVYSTLSELRVNNTAGHHYRSAYITARDHTGTWFENAYNLSEGFIHELSEVYPTTAAEHGQNGSFWVMYSEDENIGLYLDYTATGSSANQNNQGVLTENYIWAVKITPSPEDPGLESWAVEEHNAINPMTTTRVYPNPATDVLNLEVNASQTSEMAISVFNSMGQKVMEQQANLNAGINTTAISTSDLSSGIYFVTVKANGFENTMKFIVK